MSYNTIKTWTYNGDPNIYTSSIGSSATITAEELNKMITEIYDDKSDAFDFGDLFDEEVRKPIRPSMEVGPALAEMINGDLEK